MGAHTSQYKVGKERFLMLAALGYSPYSTQEEHDKPYIICDPRHIFHEREA